MQPLKQPHYAGFWVRFAASLIDTVLLLAIITPVLLMIYGKEYFQSSTLIKGPADFFLNWIFPLIAVVVFWMTESATPGKMLFHLKIVDAYSGNKPTPIQLILRYLAYYISAIPFCLGFFWVAFDKRKQGWHDKIAGTVVIYGAKEVFMTKSSKEIKPHRWSDY